MFESAKEDNLIDLCFIFSNNLVSKSKNTSLPVAVSVTSTSFVNQDVNPCDYIRQKIFKCELRGP